MTLRNIDSGEVVTMRVYKTHVGYKWANNYEVQATSAITDPIGQLQAIANRIVLLEALIHMDVVFIDRVTISTYAPDSQPYNPDTLASFPYSQWGQRRFNGDLLPLEACLFVRRNVDFGRDGRLLYRGCLSEADVTTVGLRMVVTPSALTTIQNIINGWNNQGLGQNWRFVMASGLPDPTIIRPVQSLQVSDRVVFKKFNNRYFRRRP